jgi:hypothetical protein
MENKEENRRPLYRRGSGIRVIICHEEDEQADYFVRVNRAAGNELYVDERGFIFTLVCKYDTRYRSN